MCNEKQRRNLLPEQGLPLGTRCNAEREREDDFLADEMQLCSRDHIIAVIYYLCTAEGVYDAL